MKKNTGKQKGRKERGITLIALVITIVVLIILATVSINAVFSETGIIKQAQRASEMQANATAKEAEEMNAMIKQLGSSNDIEDIEKIGAYPAPEPTINYNIGEEVAYNLDTEDIYPSLKSAIEESYTGQTIILLHNYELQEDITIPSGVEVIIPSSDSYDDRITPNCITGGENATEAYTVLKSNYTITVEGTLLIGANVRIGTGGGQGLVSGAYGQIILGDEGSIVVSSGGSVYANGYITGTGNVEVNSDGIVYQLAQLMDLADGKTEDIAFACYKAYIANGIDRAKNYYVQNIMVTTTYYNGSMLKEQILDFMSHPLMFGPYPPPRIEITKIGNEGQYSFTTDNIEDKIIMMYNWEYDKQIIQIDGKVDLKPISYISDWGSDQTYIVSTNGICLQVNGNTIIRVKKEGKLTVNQELEMQPGSGIVIEEGGELEISEGKYICLWDINDFDSHYVYTGNDENGAGEWRRTIYGEVMGEKTGKTMQETKSARIIVRGTLNAVGNIYNSERGDNVRIKEGGSVTTTLVKGEEGTATIKEMRDGTTVEEVTFKGFAI